MAKTHKIYVAGAWRETKRTLDVMNPYTHKIFATTYLASPKDIDDAISGAQKAFEKTRRLASHKRRDICQAIAHGITERFDELAKTIAQESGKPLVYARGEVARAVSTFTLAAEEATRIGGEVFPTDVTEKGEHRFSLWRRFPIGPISAISPFNFPLNLVAHKVAPAIASGNTVVLKPASATPITALLLAEIIDRTELPKGAFSVLACHREEAKLFSEDGRFKMVSFTGSPAVGWEIKKNAGKKKVVLELGGNAAVVVDKSADVEAAAKACTPGAFAYSGQVCIKVQRILVHKDAFGTFVAAFKKEAEKLVVGDPLSEKTTFGPMIDEKNAMRIEAWVGEAVKKGAKVIMGGKREKAYYPPTILTDVERSCKLSCEEAFGPVVIVEPVKDLAEALRLVNDSAFGLQAGIFTSDIDNALLAYDTLDVGGVIVNDTPMFRVDNMPYGGVKDSGFGREGVRFAIEDMTEIKLLVVNRRGDV